MITNEKDWMLIAAVSMLLAMLIGLTVGLLETPFGDSMVLESILVTLWIVGTLLVFFRSVFSSSKGYQRTTTKQRR